MILGGLVSSFSLLSLKGLSLDIDSTDIPVPPVPELIRYSFVGNNTQGTGTNVSFPANGYFLECTITGGYDDCIPGTSNSYILANGKLFTCGTNYVLSTSKLNGVPNIAGVETPEPEFIVQNITNFSKITYTGEGVNLSLITDTGVLYSAGRYNGSNSTVMTTLQFIGTGFSQVDRGSNFLIAIKTDGTLWSAGINTYGQLGTGNTTTNYTLSQVGSDTDWEKIFCGTDYAYAIKTDGTLWSWGYNNFYQLGLGTTTTTTTPTQVGSDTDWEHVSLAGSAAYLLKTNGNLYVVGSRTNYKLGTSNSGSVTTITLSTTGVNFAALGLYSGIISKSDGIYVIGTNTYGSLGLPYDTSGITSYKTTWTKINSTTSVQKVFAGRQTGNLGYISDGYLYMSGYGAGIPKEADVLNITSVLSAPKEVKTFDYDWDDYATGMGYSIAIKNGELYIDGTINTTDPNYNQYFGPGYQKIGTDTDWAKVSASPQHALMLKTDGTIWGIGLNNYLGLAGTSATLVPTKLFTSAETFTEISATYTACHAIRSDGTLWTWGFNGLNIFGNGSAANTSVNVASRTQVGSDSNWSKLYPQLVALYAIKTNGTLWCAGNSISSLGNGSSPSTLSTISQIGSDTDWASVMINATNTFFAIKTDGTLYGWGGNTRGQVGNGSTAVVSTPTQIGSSSWLSVASVGQSSGFKAPYTFEGKSWGVQSDGTFWGWGGSSSTSYSTPQLIDDNPVYEKVYNMRYGLETQYSVLAVSRY